MTETATMKQIRQMNRRTEALKKFYKDAGFCVRSDFDGRITMMRRNTDEIVVIDRTIGEVV